MTDPDFPDRPTHPDFAELTALIQKMDSPGFDIEESLKFIDEDSVIYYVAHRLPILVGAAKKAGVPPGDFMTALYVEAFSLGYHLSQERREAEQR